MYHTKDGIDLAKKVIHVCIYRDKKVLSNGNLGSPIPQQINRGKK
jgi:hypothetical protein